MRRGVLLLVAAAALAFPQGRDFFPWWDTPVARDLNLSEEQTQKVQATVREYRDRLVDLRANLEKAENQLSDLVNEDNPDPGRVNPAIERMVSARSELTRTFTQMGFRLRQVLTTQQWRELQKRRPQGPGGPGGPRMRPGMGGPGPGMGGPGPRRGPDGRPQGPGGQPPQEDNDPGEQ